MQYTQTIALLGATGKAGKYLLNHLLRKGYQVKALMRNPYAVIQNSQLTIIEGDATDLPTIEKLTEGCQVVISAIGQRQGEPLVAAVAARNIIEAMQKHHIYRYIFLSGLNLDVPDDEKSLATEAKSAWMRQHFPEVVADKQQAYELTAASGLNWTMIRLPMLEQTDEQRGIKVSLKDSPGETVSAAGLAEFLVGQIDDTSYFRQAPFVAS